MEAQLGTFTVIELELCLRKLNLWEDFQEEAQEARAAAEEDDRTIDYGFVSQSSFMHGVETPGFISDKLLHTHGMTKNYTESSKKLSFEELINVINHTCGGREPGDVYLTDHLAEQLWFRIENVKSINETINVLFEELMPLYQKLEKKKLLSLIILDHYNKIGFRPDIPVDNQIVINKNILKKYGLMFAGPEPARSEPLAQPEQPEQPARPKGTAPPAQPEAIAALQARKKELLVGNVAPMVRIAIIKASSISELNSLVSSI